MDGVSLPTIPGMQPLPGAPAMPTMQGVPSLPNSFMPNPGTAALPSTPPTPQPQQLPSLPGTSPLPAPPGVPRIPANPGQGFMDALRGGLPNSVLGGAINRSFPGANQTPGSPPAWMQGLMGQLQHGQAMGDWQHKLGSAVFGGGMTPGSGVAGYLKNLGGVATSRPAPGPNTLNTPVVGPMLAHLFGPYAGSNNGGSTSTT